MFPLLQRNANFIYLQVPALNQKNELKGVTRAREAVVDMGREVEEVTEEAEVIVGAEVRVDGIEALTEVREDGREVQIEVEGEEDQKNYREPYQVVVMTDQ